MSITRTSRRPAPVLVHGAFAESSSRNGVVDLPLEDALPALAPAKPLWLAKAAGAAASRSDGQADVDRMGVAA